MTVTSNHVSSSGDGLVWGSAKSGVRAGCHGPSVMLFLMVTVGTLGVDLLSKNLAFAHVAGEPVELSRDQAGHAMPVPFHEPVVLIPHVLSLRLTTNTGAVFGLGKGGQLVFMAVSVFAVGVIVWVFGRSQAGVWVLHVSLGLILAGAVGNLYDRLRFNAVRDLLWLFPTTGLWPWIFNVADAALLTGVAMMVWMMWRGDNKRQTDQSTPD